MIEDSTTERPDIVLLASYPKSGNTWIRALLSSLLRNSPEVQLDSLEGRMVTSLHPLCCPFPFNQLTLDEADLWHADACRAIRPNGPITLVKTHLMLASEPGGGWNFPIERIKGAVHIVRHPFDVAPSLANHLDFEIPRALESMLRDDLVMGGRKGAAVPERWGSWAQHTRSWLRKDPPFPTILVRYEDLKRDAGLELRRVAKFIGEIDPSEAALASAVEASRFERLREQELSNGFKERPVATKSFFRKGTSGEGWDALSSEQRQRLSEACGPEMSLLGYRVDRP